ncbi:cytochrome b [Sphingorhabdus sp. SMR4y]|uniref:cytochrome b n=1 Tax=Sphingorhabdus sp. SMR4y TaxID=2584094 RepID=UPI000B5CDB93|nr:cytochrome b/b6 domain-containing protein [Sphingorhabdus sp. SMR4y]ASK89313.1 cytochrome b561 [Sphingorhabdus sp. SMR4y]
MAISEEQPDSWTPFARWLHWTAAVALLVLVPVGYVMANTYGNPDPGVYRIHILASQIHQTLGLSLIALVIVRFGWRMTHPAPVADTAMAGWQLRLARVVQWALYGFLLVIPLLGWAALSSLADVPGFGPTQIWFFGHDGFGAGGMIPRIVPPVPYDAPQILSYSSLASAHRWLAYVAGAILTLHILGALRHHFILKDNVLRRMLGTKI